MEETFIPEEAAKMVRLSIDPKMAWYQSGDITNILFNIGRVRFRMEITIEYNYTNKNDDVCVTITRGQDGSWISRVFGNDRTDNVLNEIHSLIEYARMML